MPHAEFLFDPEGHVMKCVAFASGSGTNFREAVLASKEQGAWFDINLLVTDREMKDGKRIGALGYADKYNVPSITLNGYQHCGSWKAAQNDPELLRRYQEKSEDFNLKIYREIRNFENESHESFDFAVLAGYMRLFRGALLRRFANRSINVHPADLTKMVEGKRKYVGDNAVFDALNAGEERTRSSVILVDADTDAGAIIASGPWIEYAGPRPVTKESADEHQTRQKELSDWPTLRFALREISYSNFALHKDKFHKDGNPFVVYKGDEMPYGGFELS